MKKVKLFYNVSIGGVIYNTGDVLEIDIEKAEHLVKEGLATYDIVKTKEEKSTKK